MDVTSAHLGVSRDEFLAALAASKLLSDDVYARVAADSADPLILGEGLLTEGHLTAFQLDAILAGRPEDLRVGNYDLLSKLGAGGMGTVFKARHRRMKRVVAIKVLAAHLCSDIAFVQRFQREVETVARLGHPNVVMAYDADESDIGHFLVMEFVNGRDLYSAVEKGGPVSVELAVDYTLQSARGLGYAHSQGIVHRDVKPHNLLLDTNGVVKVTDLGLARLNSSTPENGQITQAGGILGTVDYMPPEQAVDSANIDARADIYSLGCTLYFLLTGTPPYSGPSLMSVLLKHRDAVVPGVRSLRPEVPVELEEICRRMMAKDPVNRYQTMDELIAVLANFGQKPQTESVTPIAPNATTPPPHTPKLVEAISVLVVEPSRVQSGIIRQYLEAQGLIVSAVVGTGGDAVATTRAMKPTAVVTSLHLADMSGVDLASQIRAELRNEAPGIIVISSEADADQVGTLSKLTRVATLAKPFSPEQLVQALSVVSGRTIELRNSASVVGLSPLKPTGSGVIAKPKMDRSAVRVLIVDDSSTARLHERKTLVSLGFTNIAEAADGAQGLAAATREAFDLIVTDYNMPLLDGRALVSYLRNHPPTAKVPIIVVTTETESVILDPLRALGVTAILEKAFPSDQVKALTDKIFGS